MRQPSPPATVAATCVYITRGKDKQLITTWGELSAAKAQIDRVIAGRKFKWLDHFTITFDDVRIQCHHLEDIMEIEDAPPLQEHEERAVDRFLSNASTAEAPKTRRELRREAKRELREERRARSATAPPPAVDDDGGGWLPPNLNPRTWQEAGPFESESQAIGVVKAKGWEGQVMITSIGHGAGRRLILVSKPPRPEPTKPAPRPAATPPGDQAEARPGDFFPISDIAAQFGVDQTVVRRAMRKAGWQKTAGHGWMIAESEIPALRKLLEKAGKL